MPLADPFTDYFTAWSTFGGAVGSILAVVVAYLLLRREIRTRAEEHRDTNAAQARLIFVQLSMPTDPRPTSWKGRLGAQATAGTELDYKVTNYSNAPIFALRGLVTRTDLDGNDGCPIAQQDLAPGGTISGAWRMPASLSRSESGEPGFGVVQSYIEFMDAAGLVWTRQDRQPPRRLTGPRDPGLLERWRTVRWVMREERAGRLPPGSAARQRRAGPRRSRRPRA